MDNRRTTGFFGGKFLPFHLGHMYAILAASCQVDNLYVVLSSSEKRDREICRRDNVKYMSAETRLSWIGESLNGLENVKIIHVEDDHGEEDYDWGEGAEMIKAAIGRSIDFVFSSEQDYDGVFSRHYPGSRHVVIDAARGVVPISATDLRRDIYGNWDFLPEPVRSYFTKKVAIVGTESCGKSTLTKKLAKFYNTNYVPEVGRQYCERYSDQLTKEMFGQIAMEHALLQGRMARDSNKVLFVDSEAVVTQYYLDMYHDGARSPLIEDIIRAQEYDLVLYLEPDVAWVRDSFRFAGDPEVRAKNDALLRRMFDERGIEYKVIGGDYLQRFNSARKHVDSLFSHDSIPGGA